MIWYDVGAAYQLSIDICSRRSRSAANAGSVMLRAEVRGSTQTCYWLKNWLERCRRPNAYSHSRRNNRNRNCWWIQSEKGKNVDIYFSETNHRRQWLSKCRRVAAWTIATCFMSITIRRESSEINQLLRTLSLSLSVSLCHREVASWRSAVSDPRWTRVKN